MTKSYLSVLAAVVAPMMIAPAAALAQVAATDAITVGATKAVRLFAAEVNVSGARMSAQYQARPTAAGMDAVLIVTVSGYKPETVYPVEINGRAIGKFITTKYGTGVAMFRAAPGRPSRLPVLQAADIIGTGANKAVFN